jgi:tetratricopeptide (TPR) repeat protein
MKYNRTTTEPMKSFDEGIEVYAAHKADTEDSGLYILKAFAAGEGMPGLRNADFEELKRMTRRMSDEAGGKLPPVSEIEKDGGRVTVVYDLQNNAAVKTLYEILRERVLDVKTVLECCIGICEALRVLHKHSCFLGFLNPTGILVNIENEIKLINYEMAADAGVFSGGYDKRQRVYADPDLFSGKIKADLLSDIYSMGKMLEIMTSVANKDVRGIVKKCTASERWRRYGSAEELERDLRAAHDSLNRPSKNKKRAMGIAAAVACILMGTVILRPVIDYLRVDPLIIRAREHRQSGNLALSAWMYNEYITTVGRSHGAYIEYARLLAENGLYDMAEDILQTIEYEKINDRQRSEYNLIMGKILAGRGDIEGSILAYTAAGRYRGPDSAGLQPFIDALAAYAGGDYESARTLFSAASQSISEDIATASYISLMRLTQITEPTPHLVLVAQRNIMQTAESRGLPLALYLQKDHALTLYTHNMRDEARPVFASLFEKAPINPDIFIQYADIQYSIGNRNIADDIIRSGQDLMMLFGKD